MATIAKAEDQFSGRAKKEAMLEDKLVKRALDRHRSTVKAKHVLVKQFEAAMAHFDVDDDEGLFDGVDPATVWSTCNNGEIKEILFRFSQGVAARAKGPDKASRPVIKLRNALLDKFHSMGGNMRVVVKKTLSHYDSDGSGELETDECVKAMAALVPGISDEQIRELVNTIDTDQSGTLTTEEITDFLIAAHDARHPQTTSLNMGQRSLVAR